MTIQIAILGAESTGKSDLIAALLSLFAAHRTELIVAVPEVLRRFCADHARAPFASEQRGILDQQIASEQNAVEQSRVESNAVEQFAKDQTVLSESPKPRAILLSDCAPITTAIYSQMYFNDPSLVDLATSHHQRYQLSLVLAPDIGWHADPLPFMRDGPTAQMDFHRRLLAWFCHTRMPYRLVAGNGQLRTHRALDAIIAAIR